MTSPPAGRRRCRDHRADRRVRVAPPAGPDDEIVVLEAGDRIGGKLHRVELAGHWYDTGAEAVLARVPEAVALRGGARARRRAGRAGDALGLRRSCPDGRHPLPAGTVLGVPDLGRRSRRAALPGRRRAGAGRGRAAPVQFDGDVAVGTLLRERLGDEVVDRLVEPLLGGIYAGRADEALAGRDDARARAGAAAARRSRRRVGGPGGRGPQSRRRRRSGVPHRAHRPRVAARRAGRRGPCRRCGCARPAHGCDGRRVASSCRSARSPRPSY